MQTKTRSRAVIAGAGTVGLLPLVLVGCSSGGTGSAPSTVTVTQTERPSPAEANTAQAATWTMPNLTGKTLQRAQDDLQALTGNPMFVSTSEDLTGQGRQQIMDRNWQVCSSTPPPGATFTSQTNVVFGVVRDSESCP